MADRFATDTDIVVLVAETVSGTFVQGTGSDTMNISDVETAVEVTVAEHKYVNGSHAQSKGTPGARPATFKCKSPLVFSGSYATAPTNALLLKKTGHKEVEYKRSILVAGAASGQKVVPVSTLGTPYVAGQVVTLKEGANTENCTIDIVGTNTVTMLANLTNTYTGSGYVHSGIGYQPLAETDDSTMSVSAYELKAGVAAPTAKKMDVAGLCGNLEIMTDGVGMEFSISVDMQGKFVDITGVLNAAVPVPTICGNQTVETLLGTTLTLGGTDQYISKFALNSGNTVERVTNQSDASGYDYARIASRKPTVSFDPIANNVSEDSDVDEIINADTNEIILTSAHFQIRVPVAQTTSMTRANREGYHSYEKTFTCLENCANGALVDTAVTKECVYEIIMGKRS